RPLASTLFPYTTLFRSLLVGQVGVPGVVQLQIGAGVAGRVGCRLQVVDGAPQRRSAEVQDAFMRAGNGDHLVSSLLLPVHQDARSEEHTSELQSRENLV